MNPNTMTIDECRDWLARDEGWYQCMYEGITDGSLRWQRDGADPLGDGEHPFPPTLDAAARALPEGVVIELYQHGDDRVIDRRFNVRGYGCSRLLGETFADTELLARFLLAVACRMACKEAK